MDDKTKLKIIAKTFLCANKGRWITSKEICDFINNNNLNSRSGVTPTQLSKYMGQHYCYHQKIDRQRKSGRNIWQYRISGDNV